MQRNSNFELLRIFAMILIVAYHYGRHGIYTFDNADLSINKFFISFLKIGGQFGVSLFVLITGYFLINKKFKSFRVIKLIVDTWYYSLLGLLFAVIVLNQISSEEIIKSLFPMIFERYWFVTSYLLLLVFSPFLNLWIKNLSNTQFKSLLFLFVFIWGFVRTIFMVELNYSNFIWFIVLYMTGAYINIYYKQFKLSWKNYLVISLLLYLFIIVIVYIYDVLAVNDDIYNYYSSYFVKITSLPLFISAVNLFLVSVKYPSFKNNTINNISTNIFSVYLIHDNDLFRNYMWREIFSTPTYQHTILLYLHIVFTIASILLFSILFDYISRKLFLTKIEMKLKHFSERLDLRISKYFR